ncbi:MAG TPA: hypothetical protein VL096_13930 [Pirellulaceae bacterium]|nr:hypothetical protein [Pirellulaceae bacterium]
MSRLLLLLGITLSLVATVGCGPSVKDKLTGKWRGKLKLDPAAVEKKKAEADNPIVAAAAEALVKEVERSASLDVDFKADGTMTEDLHFGERSEHAAGSWEVKSVEGNKVVLLLKKTKGNDDFNLTLADDFLTGNGGFTVDSPAVTQGLGVIVFQRQ